MTQTIIRKSHYGWLCETTVKTSKHTCQITTMRRANGLISTVVQFGRFEKSRSGSEVFVYTVYQDEVVKLFECEIRATKLNIEKAHDVGIVKFNELYDVDAIIQQI